ncbi:psbP domain-containing protein 5, chloroplastic-like isoform X2 [Chenopodium quinoa]|uniref:psbP domain-containing protein 5, chloroplastic-like isoform X2 n=1 Tax=Chenopodium quinoa TaxID=63459 RepID=UPI000B79AA4E|nr:psbP domain-containing protein 5, chloroplastic-like isoform X2 [Chenopodium quinoa]
MAYVFHSYTPTIFNSPSQLPSHLLLFRNQINSSVFLKKCKSKGKIISCSCDSSIPTSVLVFCKRDLLLFGLSSSMALIFPTNANARLRIVSERVDFIDNVIISVTIGPSNPEFLKSKDKSTWNPKDVADSVLSDKSALRVTSTQKLAESSILDAQSNEVDGERYLFYEYLVRKSPTKSAQESNNYRQYVAPTAEHDGMFLAYW